MHHLLNKKPRDSWSFSWTDVSSKCSCRLLQGKSMLSSSFMFSNCFPGINILESRLHCAVEDGLFAIIM